MFIGVQSYTIFLISNCYQWRNCTKPLELVNGVTDFCRQCLRENWKELFCRPLVAIFLPPVGMI